MTTEEKQLRVLCREFMFRIVDLEILAARGDAGKLLGQFAALLAALSLMLAVPAIRFLNSLSPREGFEIAAWPDEHFLIATTMVVVGLFAVLSWDSIFLSQRDVLVLGPLPIRTRTLCLARAAASAGALSLTVIAVNVFTGVAYPVVLGASVPELFRFLVAYWVTMFAAGAFVFCSLLCVQGLAAQVFPRRWFLRLSAVLQMAAFCIVLSVYFLQPSWATPRDLTASAHQPVVVWLPSYWFLGLLHELAGTMHPALIPLLRRAFAGLLIATLGAAFALLLSYFRALRRIIEEPDVAPGVGRASWSPQVGSSLTTAVVHFSVRSLFRSGQHRVVLAFYVGVGFAIALAYSRDLLYGSASALWYQVNEPLLIASTVMMCFAVVGVRVVFSLPVTLKANWIFQTTARYSAREYMAATRMALILIGVAPVWLLSAALLLALWPLWTAAGHLAVLALLGMIFSDLSAAGFKKIPFTCAYLPGRANVHVTSGAYVIVLVALVETGMRLEMRALETPASFAAMVVVLAVAALGAWRLAAARARSPEALLRFEEVPVAEVLPLDLHRDGALVVDSAVRASRG